MFLLIVFFLGYFSEVLSAKLVWNPNSRRSYNKISLGLAHRNIENSLSLEEFFKGKNDLVSNGAGEKKVLQLSGDMYGIFRSGTVDEYVPEWIAYKMSLLLKFPSVPPVVLRKVDGKMGSVQYCVENSQPLLDRKIYRETIEAYPPVETQNRSLFDFLLGNWDFGPHNLLSYSCRNKIHLIPIDYEQISTLPYQQARYDGNISFLCMYGGNRFWPEMDKTLFLKDFPFEKKVVIQRPTNSQKFREVFKDQLPEAFYQSFKERDQEYHVVFHCGRLWRQLTHHRYNDVRHVYRDFTEKCCQKTLSALISLTLPQLEKVFGLAPEWSLFRDPIYAKAVLQRRDQIVEFFQKPVSKKQ